MADWATHRSKGEAIFTTSVEAQCGPRLGMSHAGDKAALIDLCETNPGDWCASWRVDDYKTDPCKDAWEGVHCDANGNRVTSLCVHEPLTFPFRFNCVVPVTAPAYEAYLRKCAQGA